ncbi:MAG: PqqD family peptide modification chaperone [Gemmatimonadales bacterium]|jgi:hypothetical protein
MSVEHVARVLVECLERTAAGLGLADEGAVLDLAHRFGMPGFVVRHTGRTLGGLQAQAARSFYQRTLADAAGEVTAALAAAGVPHFFARGVVLAETVYRPGDREIADIDLYVRPDARARAVETLTELGYRELAEGAQGGAAVLRVGTTLERRSTGGSPFETVQLDLHWGVHPIHRLLHTPDARIPAVVWDQVAPRPRLPAPTVEHHAALLVQHLAYHDLLHVRGLLDLVLLWSTSTDFDGAAFEAAARELGVLRVTRAVHAALTAAFGFEPATGVGVPPGGWRGRRLMGALALEEWLRWAAVATAADHLRMTPRRLARRFLLLERASDARHLLRDILRPPREHLRWRWPDASTDFTAWLRHLRHVAGQAAGSESAEARLPRAAAGTILAGMEPDSIAERPRARDDVVFRQLDEEWVLFDPVSDRLHALNLTGALIWTHLTGDLTLDEIADEVGKAFDPPMPTDRVLPDVRDAVERFRQERLLARA